MMLMRLIIVVVLSTICIPPLRTLLFYMDWTVFSFNHHPGECTRIKTYGAGSEDLRILSSGLSFFSSGLLTTALSPQFKAYAKLKGNGTIQMIDMNRHSPVSQILPIKHGKDFNPAEFRPHGIDVLEDKVKGEHLVYTVTHVENEADRVDKFRYSPNTKELVHEKSIFNEEFTAVNDLTVLAEDKFYITNFNHYNKSHAMFLVENVYMWRLGKVFYYDGGRFTRVLEGLVAPNGIELSADKRHLYLSQFSLKTIHVYEIQSHTRLELVQEIDVHTAVDNFHLSDDGSSLYAGCLPVMHKLAAHLQDPGATKSPSQVIRMPLENGLIQENEITQEFYDQGNLISGSTVAAVYKGRMLIGSVMDSLVMCQLPSRE